MRDLSPLEARVVAVLVEKQATVPDTYPLSLNALVAGCNQKTAREPVMSVDESQVLNAIDGLKSMSLVFEGSGSRVVRYEHNLGRVMAVPSQAVALLATLMLRGPQTAAELRAHSERLHRFADISSVEGFLDELADRYPPKVLKLPRAPGAREARWMHLLCGEPDPAVLQAAAAAASATSATALSAADLDELAVLRAEHRQLSAEVAALRELVTRIAGELGVSIDPPAAG
ncbi:MAG TPA: YceH family protein [Burkholderiaceae bacterium]|nr:YceH family protein [Burkholderiaceae bacterium]HMX12300.1 YceH family protein [Burkholderiaceae bacterium]HNB46457.1 YceH family protein [Burkholderiaceae bacterium]HNG82658.1 YceH family protein [Burkholderiaceae bacterium]